MPRLVIVAGDKTRVKDAKVILDSMQSELPGCSGELLLLEPLYYAEASSSASSLGIPFRTISDFQMRDAAHILKSLEPDIIILGEDMAPSYRAFIEAGRFLGIPTVLVMCGIFGEMPFSIRNFAGVPRYLSNLPRLLRSYRFLYRTLVSSGNGPFGAWKFIVHDVLNRFVNWSAVGESGCDLICVSGEHYRDVLLMKGRSPTSVVVTGQPRFDGIAAVSRDSQVLRSSLHLENDLPIVSLMTDAMVEHGLWTDGRRREYFRSILNAVYLEGSDPAYNLVVKIHPFEETKPYQDIVSELGFPVAVTKDVDLHDLIFSSSVVVIGTSTTGLESLLLGRRLIVARFYGEHEYVPYGGGGVALIARTPDQLREMIEVSLRKDPEFSRGESEIVEMFLSRHALRSKEGAGARIVRAAWEIVTNRNRQLVDEWLNEERPQKTHE